MKRRQLLGSTGAVAAAAFAGCLGGGSGGSDGDERTITVSKSGEVTAEPDMAVVRAAVEATGDDQTAVRDELSQRADRLTEALQDAGIDAEAITTDRFDIRDRTDRRPAEEAESGPTYVGVHAFRIEVDDADAAGEIVDTAVEAGADDIGRIGYTLSEERQAELREEALQSALEAARTEAEFVAGEVDASVGDVVTVDTDQDRVSPAYETAEDDAGGRSTELRPDDVTVRATATVSYRLD
ncbi:MAG: SIMPL domain-containing protein [Halohasta sp.]